MHVKNFSKIVCKKFFLLKKTLYLYHNNCVKMHNLIKLNVKTILKSYSKSLSDLIRVGFFAIY